MFATLRAYPVFAPQIFLLLLQPNLNSALLNELLLERGSQSSFDADSRDKQANGLAAHFVYVFRGVSERERRGRKGTAQTAASAECGARGLSLTDTTLPSGIKRPLMLLADSAQNFIFTQFRFVFGSENGVKGGRSP